MTQVTSNDETRPLPVANRVEMSRKLIPPPLYRIEMEREEEEEVIHPSRFFFQN